MSEDFVYIGNFGFKGSNFYWNKCEQYGITKDELFTVGVTSDKVFIHKDILGPLASVEKELEKHGFKLFIKEGYRSKDLYNLVYRKRVEKFGKEKTDSLLNINDMPHALGKSVDVALWDSNMDKEVYVRAGEDGTDALFADFYKNKTDEQSKNYQSLQELLIKTMQKNGFRLGKLREYFHFDYRPETPENY